MNLFKHIYPAIALTIVLTVLVGTVYPFVITGLSELLFKEKARGSLIEKEGKAIGSRLIGQPFNGAGYFHSRPSAAGSGYDATASVAPISGRQVSSFLRSRSKDVQNSCALKIRMQRSLST
jgi:K+-transporting ATPase KdpC subunit